MEIGEQEEEKLGEEVPGTFRGKLELIWQMRSKKWFSKQRRKRSKKLEFWGCSTKGRKVEEKTKKERGKVYEMKRVKKRGKRRERID